MESAKYGKTKVFAELDTSLEEFSFDPKNDGTYRAEREKGGPPAQVAG